MPVDRSLSSAGVGDKQKGEERNEEVCSSGDELTCAGGENDGADRARSYETARARQGAVYGVENSQDDGVEALKFVELAALGALEIAP
jgi:hypothetical protein